MSFEGRKGCVHLPSAEYIPICYRPTREEINQNEFHLFGSSVKKHNMKKIQRYSCLQQKTMAKEKTITYHQLLSKRLAVFKKYMN